MIRNHIRIPVAICLGAFLLLCSFANAAKPDVVTRSLTPLVGGDVASDVIDVATMPFLALPPSIGGENKNALGAAPARGPGLDLFSESKSSLAGCAYDLGDRTFFGYVLTYGDSRAGCQPPHYPIYFSLCMGPNGSAPCYYYLEFKTFYDVPVGGTLRFCSISGVPAGWTVTQQNLPGSCAFSGPDSVMQHTSCVAGDTNCYPASATISASPQTFTVPYGQSYGSTTINWNTTNVNSPCIWIKNTGGTDSVWACDGSGAHSQVWPYVPYGGTTTLWVSGGGSSSPLPKLAQVVVTGNAGAVSTTLTATPNPVQVPYGQTAGPFDVYWTAPGSSNVDIYLSADGGTRFLWGPNQPAIGHSSLGASMIPRGSTFLFQMYPHGSTTSLLKSLTVYGVSAPTPTLTATPNPVQVPNGQPGGPFDVYWTAAGYSNVDIYLSANGGPRYLWGPDQAAPGHSILGASQIPAGSTFLFEMYPHGNPALLLKSLTVTGVTAPATSLTATPNPVIVPVGQPYGTFDVYWTASGYSNVDIYLSANGGIPFLWGQNQATPGHSTLGASAIAPNDSYLFTMYPAGQTSPLLKSLTVTAHN
jgi:hypothetical protein